MASKVDTKKVNAALKKLVLDRFAEYGAAVFNAKIEAGDFKKQMRKAGAAHPNKRVTLARKARLGQGSEPWVATGKTKAAMTTPHPAKFNIHKGLQMGYGKQPREHVYIRPVTFGYAAASLKKKGKKVNLKAQWAALGAVDWGSKKKAVPQRRMLYWESDDTYLLTKAVERLMKRRKKEVGF